MVALVFGMILVLCLGLAVVLAVALPARREGRDLLTPHGEDVVAKVRERTGTLASATAERTGDLVNSAKDRVDAARERVESVRGNAATGAAGDNAATGATGDSAVTRGHVATGQPGLDSSPAAMVDAPSRER
jgi:hypothetical protein